jgi:hypothetical protein
VTVCPKISRITCPIRPTASAITISGRRIWLDTGRVAAQLSDSVIFSPIAAAGRTRPIRVATQDAPKTRPIPISNASPADCVSPTTSATTRPPPITASITTTPTTKARPK